jgi:hypothetical protein
MTLVKLDLTPPGLLVAFGINRFVLAHFFDVAGAVSLDVLTNERFKSALWADVNAGWLHEMTFGAFFRKFSSRSLVAPAAAAFMPSFWMADRRIRWSQGSRGDAQCHCDQKSGRHLSGCSSQSAAKRLQPADFTLCRPGVDNAANIAIKTGYQNTNTDDYFCGASLEAMNHHLPFFVGVSATMTSALIPALLNCMVTKFA